MFLHITTVTFSGLYAFTSIYISTVPLSGLHTMSMYKSLIPFGGLHTVSVYIYLIYLYILHCCIKGSYVLCICSVAFKWAQRPASNLYPP
jgi:hypothetical protein